MSTDRISDPSDLATERERLYREAALRARKPMGPKPSGFCLNCGEPVRPPRRWCDKDCRDDWEMVERIEQKHLEQQRVEDDE